MEYVNLVVLILIAIGVFFRDYILSYAKKKGENLATKEDIAGITQQIETVTSDYKMNIEKLRASLQVVTSHVATVRDYQREAMIDFYDKALLLLLDKLQTNFGDFPYDDGKTLWDYQEATKSLFTGLYVSYHRLLLFSEPGSEYLHAAAELLTDVFLIGQSFRSKFSKLKSAILDEWIAHKSDDHAKYSSAVDKTNEAARTYNTEMGPLHQQAMDRFSNYVKALNRYLLKEYGATIPTFLSPST